MIKCHKRGPEYEMVAQRRKQRDPVRESDTCQGVKVFGLCVEVFGRIRIHGAKKDIHSMYAEGIL